MIVLLYIFVAYSVVKCIISFINLFTKPVLKAAGNSICQDKKISVLVPARNEAGRIDQLLHSLLIQDYQNLEVFVLDDGSIDGTSEVVEEFAVRSPKVQLIKGKPVANGWLGKNYACHQLAEKANGEYLFFLDADVVVNKGFFEACLLKMNDTGVDILSVFNDQKMKTPGEFLAVPLMHYILLALLPLRLVLKSDNPAFAAASGQCMVFKRSNYEIEQWHQLVKNIVTEDISIFKVAKKKGYRTLALLAGDLIYCRMYKNFSEALDGFGKNLLAGFENSIAGLLAFTSLELLFFVSLFKGETFMISGLAIGLTLLTRLVVSIQSRQNLVLNVFLHPVQVIVLLIIAIISIYRKLTKTNRWKGRLIDIQSA